MTIEDVSASSTGIQIVARTHCDYPPGQFDKDSKTWEHWQSLGYRLLVQAESEKKVSKHQCLTYFLRSVDVKNRQAQFSYMEGKEE